MVDKSDYKDALKLMDKDTRIAFKYLEGLMEEKFKLALQVKQPRAPKAKVDLSRLESKDDSLQKQINGLRSKVDAVYSHVQEHDESEKAIKILISRAEKILDHMKEQFEELYNSGYYSEGTKRKLRDEGLIKGKRE